MADEKLLHENGNVTKKDDGGEENSEEEIDYRMGIGKWKPEWLQKFCSMKCFVVVLSIASLVQGIIVNGLTIVSIPSVEKEFGISSKAAGLIVAGNDASALLLVGAISFFGTKGHKPRWMGIGVLIMGIGGFLYALPKLLVGSYEPIGTNVTVLDSCTPNKSTPQLTCNENSSLLNVAIFFIAQFIMGGGTTPLYTLGPAFLDENVSPRASPIYLGIHFAATMLGPGSGFVLGSTFLRVFTNIEQPEDMKLTTKDSRWIGAWWLGFVSMSGLFFISGAFLLLFPKEMKTGKEKRLKAIEKGDMPSSDTTIQYTLKGYIMASMKICFNKVFMLAVAALTVKMVYTIGMVSFLVKIMVVKFGVPSHKSGMILGTILMPTMIIGILAGSYIMRRVKVALVTKTAAKLCVILSLMSVPAGCMYLVPGCQNTNMAGQAVPYSNETSLGDLYSQCNSKCYCSKRAYIPVCGSDGITYHSPCFAGCSFTYFNNDTKKPEFGNCSCIPPMRKKNMSQFSPSTLNTLNIDKSMINSDPTKIKGLKKIGEFIEHKTNDTIELLSKFQQMQLLVKTLYNKATFGPCDRDCKNFHIFIIILIPLVTLSFISGTPHKMITLRSVPDNQRAFALGTQLLFVRSLSFLPGPIIMGAVVDSQCTTWLYDQCGNKKNCADYNADVLSRNIVIFAALVSAIAAVLYSIIVCIAPSKQPEENTEDEGKENFILS